MKRVLKPWVKNTITILIAVLVSLFFFFILSLINRPLQPQIDDCLERGHSYSACARKVGL